MLRFYCSIHARLSNGPAQPGGEFSVSFDRAAAELARLPRMFLEPDGAFVWVGQVGERRWQVDGVLYDRGDRLAWVELRGECPEEEFDRLLAIFGREASGFVFQLHDSALLIDEATFRRHAEGVSLVRSQTAD